MGRLRPNHICCLEILIVAVDETGQAARSTRATPSADIEKDDARVERHDGTDDAHVKEAVGGKCDLADIVLDLLPAAIGGYCIEAACPFLKVRRRYGLASRDDEGFGRPTDVSIFDKLDLVAFVAAVLKKDSRTGRRLGVLSREFGRSRDAIAGRWTAGPAVARRLSQRRLRLPRGRLDDGRSCCGCCCRVLRPSPCWLW